MAYTPGLKRKELVLVRKTRRLPIKGNVLVSKGDQVSFDTIVAKADIPGNPVIVNVFDEIGLDPTVDDLSKHMLKKVGDPVEKDEPLAMTSMFFGLSKRFSKSPIKGSVERLSQAVGQVILREPPVPVEVKAYIPGIVNEVFPGDGVSIETPATFIQGIFGVGGETHGEIMIAPIEKTRLKAEDIVSNCSNKILVAKGAVEFSALKKLKEIGAKGVIIGGMDEDALAEFIGHDIGVAITGNEDIGLTLVITEGFGEMMMPEKTFDLLKKAEGTEASLNGLTQIRAGVIRPEIIIPKTVSTSGLTRSDFEDTETLSQGLGPGTLIRIIRGPNFGALARVVSLPPTPKQIETESYVQVLEARLENGRHVMVPRANVEIIGE